MGRALLVGCRYNWRSAVRGMWGTRLAVHGWGRLCQDVPDVHCRAMPGVKFSLSPLVISLAVIGGAITGCSGVVDRASQVASDCDNTRSEIVELSEKDRPARGYALIKIYEPTQVSRTEQELRCTGRASWSDGDETRIDYRSYLDPEGERFVEYEVPQ